MKKVLSIAFTVIFALTCCAGLAYVGWSIGDAIVPTVKLEIDANAPSHAISENLFGLFLEDINYAADGGLCANLIKNNSFELKYVEDDPTCLDEALAGWSTQGTATRANPMSSTNTVSLRVDLSGASSIVCNYGYPDVDEEYGIYVREGIDYDFSCYIDATDFTGAVSFCVKDENAEELLGERELNVTEGEGYVELSLVGRGIKTGYGRTELTLRGSGTAYLDMFSLVPCDSFGYDSAEWKYTSLRPDLVETLRELCPGFLRFPGGCCTEGAFFSEYSYNWKTTLGELNSRIQIPNLWGYNQSMELGFYEYFLLSEELGAEPIPVLNAGITCQSREYQWYEEAGVAKRRLARNEEGDPCYVEMAIGSAEFNALIQDYLDLIEYCNGGTDTYWGAVRAANGHPEPFNLKYVGVGNENWDNALYNDLNGNFIRDEEEPIIGWEEAYFSRFDLIYKAIKAEYPQITVISSAGAASNGAEFEHAWKKINASYADTVADEHYYVAWWELAEVFSDRYDSYPRDGAKVFVGEYSANVGGGWNISRNNLGVAIAEAAYMTGLERNGDVVELAAYAPLLAKYGRQQWVPDLIWFELDKVIKTPSYYVQQLFAANLGDTYLTTEWSGKTEKMYKSVTIDTENEVIIIKIVNDTDTSQTCSIDLNGFENVRDYATVQYLGSAYTARINNAESTEVALAEKSLKVKNGKITYDTGARSLNVIRVGYGNNKTELRKKTGAASDFFAYIDKKYDEVNAKHKAFFRNLFKNSEEE